MEVKTPRVEPVVIWQSSTQSLGNVGNGIAARPISPECHAHPYLGKEASHAADRILARSSMVPLPVPQTKPRLSHESLVGILSQLRINCFSFLFPPLPPFSLCYCCHVLIPHLDTHPLPQTLKYSHSSSSPTLIPHLAHHGRQQHGKSRRGSQPGRRALRPGGRPDQEVVERLKMAAHQAALHCRADRQQAWQSQD
jgi:hypothetical protein